MVRRLNGFMVSVKVFGIEMAGAISITSHFSTFPSLVNDDMFFAYGKTFHIEHSCSMALRYQFFTRSISRFSFIIVDIYYLIMVGIQNALIALSMNRHISFSGCTSDSTVHQKLK